MADFDAARRQLQEARATLAASRAAAAAAQARVARLAARVTDLARRGGQRTDDAEERRRLAAERERAAAELEARRRAEAAAAALAARATADFGRLADPRQQIERLDDELPILLLPVRLETRFKTIAADGPAPRQQLWVRVYPDDCSIDTFEPELSPAEVANARLYWTAVWESGRITEQERGAWQGLVAGHGPDRAQWIRVQYQPLNLPEQPSKALATDVILTIATDAPLSPAEALAAAAFWRAAWLADGDQALTAAASAALVAALGDARATAIAADYVPANFATRPAPPLGKSQVTLSVAFVHFPPDADVPTRPHGWSRAPLATLLPDRFVLIATSAGQPPLVRLGNPIAAPLAVGPDPSAPESEQLRQQDGALIVPEPMRWMTDFARAVEVGMGFRVDLDAAQAARGFDRLLVVGLRLSEDAASAQVELERLIEHHHFSGSGFSLVPQGTPTNNTEGRPAGDPLAADADASFDALADGGFTARAEWLDKCDGQWLAEYLGIDAAVLQQVRHARGTDQAEARAMNAALWPATIGYWMETMMAPVFDPATVDRTREFACRFVLGRGAVPAIRIGRQPYGILPATAFSRMRWLRDRAAEPALFGAAGDDMRLLPPLAALLGKLEADWARLVQQVSFAGKPGDAHQTLLDLIGLHPGSVEFAQRHAESGALLFNRLNLEGLGGLFTALVATAIAQSARDLLGTLGYGGPPPDILDKFFFGTHNLLKGPLVQAGPLSERDALRPATSGGRNYLQWLIEAANSSQNALYAQQGFIDDAPPTALLYLLLRHALQLGYHDTTVRLHVASGLLAAAQVPLAKRDAPFLHIAESATVSESRYRLLYTPAPAITGSATTLIGDYIGAALPTLAVGRYLRQQVAALERLQLIPTARLERVFAEHLDCCAYRLDAWRLGLVHCQLARMRNLRDGVALPARRGIHLGAYAWLEDLRPQAARRTPVRLPDDLDAVFDAAADPPLERDSTNQGYIHAPSLDQAVAAAVLRNGYVSDASPSNRQTLAVNLTSERVRGALAMLEGIRGGQSLGALLGYQFERGLHDRHALAEVDELIFDLRKAFPLRADRLQSTRTDPDVPIEAIEARNVIDGLALISHVKGAAAATYPFGKPLPAASAAQRVAVDAEVQRMLDSHDAVADLALAEGVYQAVLGNYDRVASTYDAYSRGHFPPEPQVVRTPTSGVGLTHRVALHLESGADPTLSPLAGVAMTPRAQIEPAVNRWLAALLPPLAQVGVVVAFRDAATNTLVERQVALADLQLQPVDLLRLLRGDSEQAMAELDDRVVRHAVAVHAPRPDTPVAIRYLDTLTAPLAVFQVLPLVRALDALIQRSRPLRATDLALSGEATTAQDQTAVIDPQRVELVRDALEQLRGDLAPFQAGLDALLDDPVTNRAAILAAIETHLTTLTALLARAAAFAIAQAGWGFTYAFKQRAFATVLRLADELVGRWGERELAFDTLRTEYDALPGTATEAQRFELLQRAEVLVASTRTDPLPPLPDDFRTALLAQRAAFAARRTQFAALQQTTRTMLPDLLADVAALSTAEFDPQAFTLTGVEDDIVQGTVEAASVARVVGAEIERRLGAAQAPLAQHAAAAEPAARVAALIAAAQALLGEDVVIVPEFALGAAPAAELAAAFAASQTPAPFTYLVDTLGVDFPLDTWLYGVARVREKLRRWEQVVMHAGAVANVEPELVALQLPFAAGEPWLGLEFPPDQAPQSERLLYTAHFATPFAPSTPQCGLLLDEWEEVIPAREATTGIAFHYDRPNHEAPQTMLLVTPSEFRGAWQWIDVVDALHETLDLAKRRAVEPAHLEGTPYAALLPATVTAVTVSQLTISANLALNNDLHLLWSGA